MLTPPDSLALILKGNKKIGTGFLIDFEGMTFLISAKHNFEEDSLDQSLILLGDSRVSLAGKQKWPRVPDFNEKIVGPSHKLNADDWIFFYIPELNSQFQLSAHIINDNIGIWGLGYHETLEFTELDLIDPDSSIVTVSTGEPDMPFMKVELHNCFSARGNAHGGFSGGPVFDLNYVNIVSGMLIWGVDELSKCTCIKSEFLIRNLEEFVDFLSNENL